jgi:hypothetical protein
VNPVRQTAEGSRRLRFDAGPVTLTGERPDLFAASLEGYLDRLPGAAA